MLGTSDLDLLKDIDILYNNQIILFGAGNCGKRTLKMLRGIGISVLGFCDSNVMKWDKFADGCPILRIDELIGLSKKGDIIIIITVENPDSAEEIWNFLNGIGVLKEADCYTYFALRFSIELHIEDKRISESYRTEFILRKNIFYEKLEAYRKWFLLDSIGNTIFQEQAVLILNPAKVGSSSVRVSLETVGIPCQQIHSITGRWNTFSDKLKEGVLLFKKAEKIRIISLLRDPIARDISIYFQCFRREYIMNVMRLDSAIVKADTHQGIGDFLMDEVTDGVYGAMFRWFDMEIRDPFGIDILAYDFDKEKGYQIINKENIELMLIKMEKLDECEAAIGRFVQDENFVLIKDNYTYNRLERFAYEEIKNTIKIPKRILDFYYKGNRAVDHFYTQGEKEEFYRKWGKTIF